MAWQRPKTDWNQRDNWAGNGDADLLRVIGNCDYLAKNFRAYHYRVKLEGVVTNGYKTMGYIPLFNTLIADVGKLRAAFYVKGDTQVLPPLFSGPSRVDYTLPNALEGNLRDMEELFENMKKDFRFAGAMAAGEQTILPGRVI